MQTAYHVLKNNSLKVLNQNATEWSHKLTYAGLKGRSQETIMVFRGLQMNLDFGTI